MALEKIMKIVTLGTLRIYWTQINCEALSLNQYSAEKARADRYINLYATLPHFANVENPRFLAAF